MTNDVAIIGVGLHPFGRFDKTAMEMGAEAIQFALDDAGVDWRDIQFGFGGSHEVSNPDAVTRLVGLTGITFTNVFNACATAASAIAQTADTIRLGKYDIGIAIGLDKHPRGAFTDDPAKLALPQWYAENGQFVTTKFFGMKANHYLHKHGISQETLAKVAAKNFRNGEKNPNAFRRKPISEEEILNSPVLNYPLTQYMFCAPDEGAAAVIMCRGDIAHRFTEKAGVCEGHRDPDAHLRRLRGARDIRAARRGRVADGVRRQGRLRGGGHRAGGRRHRAAAGHRRGRRGDPHGRDRPVRRRRTGEAARRRRHRDRWLDARQHRRRTDRQRRADRRFRAAAGARAGAPVARRGGRPPGAGRTRRSGLAQVYGAPGTASATILSV